MNKISKHPRNGASLSPTKAHKHSETGNVLWFVMVGVILMAGLAMTLSRTGANVESSGDKEKRSIEALHIMRHAKALETAVQNLKFQEISENDISFENPKSSTDYTNTNCTNNNCKIFHIEGAGLTYLSPKTAWLDSAQSAQDKYGEWIFTGNSCIPGLGTGDDETCVNSDTQLEIVAILPYVKKNLCQQINTLTKINLTGSNPPADIDNVWDNTTPEFTGTFNNAQNIADTNEDLFHQGTGCFEGGGTTPASGSYHFYHALLAR